MSEASWAAGDGTLTLATGTNDMSYAHRCPPGEGAVSLEEDIEAQRG